MRGNLRPQPWMLRLVVAVLPLVAGCHGTARRTITGSTVTSSGEPAFSSNVVEPGSGVTIVEPAAPALVTPPQPMSWIDRHPLLRKPRHYYESTNSNKFVKTAAATVVGVPAGIVGELKQIVVGKPSTATY